MTTTTLSTAHDNAHHDTATPIWHTQSTQEVLSAVNSDAKQGLHSADAYQLLEKVGYNELEERGGKSPFAILWEQFTSTMVLILIAAAVVSAFLGKPLETIAISAIVVLFALLGFVQEYRAERAIAALKQLAVPLVRVIRGGATEQVSARELVPGDVVVLEAGSAIPADLRIIESSNLRVQEAALTGESEAVDKQTNALANDNLPLGDRVNMAYMGTAVTYGRGTGVVVATGMRTELGRIAELIQEVESQDTPLQRQLDQVGTLLAVAGVIVAILVLIIGVLREETLADMFLTAVSVAVAVVPEGLPAVVTMTLALGAQRMLRRKALIRKLPAVETLGSVSVICSDKTGTLTENRMTVTVLDVAGHYIELQGTAKTNKITYADETLVTNQPHSVGLLLVAGALCNDASLAPDPTTGRYLPVGDPTEGALLVAATQAGLDKDDIEGYVPRVGEVPFDSDRKRMTTIHQLPEDRSELPALLTSLNDVPQPYVALTKGAFDGMLSLATHVWVNDHPEPLSDHWRERMQSDHDQLAEKGMRVLALAIKPYEVMPHDINQNIERDLIIIGLTGMIDPPRPEVREAIRLCRSAGIRPIMITGDHPLTARFIAHELGISENMRVKTGNDLDSMSEEEVADAVKEVSVYARVTPEHKLRIVELLQNQGEIAAMTGDGVNDSPALRKADIGVAMGITGTDVSKEAAQMVLLDDNFTTIVAAVEEGRSIYENIRRFVKFSIAGNLGKVLVMLFAPFMGIAVALLPLQLLWLNLLTDGLLGLGLGVEPADKSIMQAPPRRKDTPFFSRPIVRDILLIGGLIGMLALVLGFAYYDPANPDNLIWQTMMFTSIAFMQIGQALASRSNTLSFFQLGFFSNPTLLAMVVITFGLQLMALYVPFLEDFFQIVPLGLPELLICFALGVLVFVAIEVQKWFLRRGVES
jgi:Ca2+-transporting ATPase